MALPSAKHEVKQHRHLVRFRQLPRQGPVSNNNNTRPSALAETRGCYQLAQRLRFRQHRCWGQESDRHRTCCICLRLMRTMRIIIRSMHATPQPKYRSGPKKTFTANCSEPFSKEFWKCDIDEDHIEAVEGRVVWVDLHDFQGFDLVPQMSLEAKEAFEEANPSARINEHQCWPLHLPDICHPHPNAEASADVNATHPTSPPVSLQTRMRSALQVSVESEIHNQPGIDNDMCPI